MSVDLPKVWDETKLENLFSFVIGGDWGKDLDHTEPDFVEVICIRGSEFKKWDKEKGSTATPRKIKKSSLDTRKLKSGDILVEISGGGPDQPVGRVVLIESAVFSNHNNPNLVCTNFLRLARPIDLVSSKYLNLYLKKFYLSGEVVNYQGGSNNLRNLKFNDYLTISIPVPPLAEQQQIAAKLDELLAQVDSLKTRLDAIPKILKRFRQSVLDAAVSGGLTKDWRNKNGFSKWEDVVWGDILHPSKGSFKRGPFGSSLTKSMFISEGYKIYEQYCPINDDCSYERYYIDENKFNEMQGFEVLDGDFLISCSGVSLGRITQVPKGSKRGIINQALLRVRLDHSKYNSEFFKILFRSPSFQKVLFENSTGSAIPNLKGVKELKNIIIPLISLEEQAEIVCRVEQLFTYADQIEQRVKDAQSRVNHLTQSILAKAFRGELTAEWREQNPDLISGENSAEALLARIQAEREASGKVTKRSRKVV